MNVILFPIIVQWRTVLPSCPTVIAEPSIIVTVGFTGGAVEGEELEVKKRGKEEGGKEYL